ncbi:MAG TPA: M20/M25/M40 family metallo-hydrolase [Gemmatimonadaceae bacterium]|nr:M20/M25/M40 family metallo-hydrolase [Gemmatimonadaceae bacterium]
MPTALRHLLAAAMAAAAAAPLVAQRAIPTPDSAARAAQTRLIEAATQDSAAWLRLAELVDTFGNRPSGSTRLEQALDWIVARMKADGLENVHTEAVMVPHWERGAESAVLLTPRLDTLHMLGLGRSVGTPKGGITAPVLVVSDFADLRAHAAEAKGRIVLFDFPFDSTKPPFAAYGEAVQYRGSGPDSAAQFGAVAVLVRSVTPASIRSPHTGALHYGDSTRAIPAAAVTVEDAMMLHRMQARGQRVTVRLTMGARTLPPAPSRNVVAEVRGSEHPEQVVIVSGHIDSWDVGQGAMDDGGGAVAAWEAVRLMKRLGLHPRRTVRVVLWTNEESGLAGGRAYAQAHKDELANVVLAMESDNGVFTPRGLYAAGNDSIAAALRRVIPPLAAIGVTTVTPGEPEADVSPMFALGVPVASLDVDASRYFWYHHTYADTPDKLDPRAMAKCVATLAATAYGVAW